MKTFFCNRTVDKGEMKRLIKWVLLNYGTEKTTRLIDQLKTTGFHYATHAGISLGIDELLYYRIDFLRDSGTSSLQDRFLKEVINFFTTGLIS